MDSGTNEKHTKAKSIDYIESSKYFSMFEQPQQFNATMMKAVKSVK
ncbi:hypothetical protein QTO05_15705 [Vibrio fortis]